MEVVTGTTPETLAQHRALVRQLIEADARTNVPSHGAIEALALCDEAAGSYMVLYVGWSGNHRHHDVIIHARLRDGKVWIERDGTEEGFANRLLEAGVPREDIVLAFQHPRKRPFTDFAVA